MDNFDKLISQKIDQIQLPDAEQAWNDFDSFRAQQIKAARPIRKSAHAFLLVLVGLLLLFMGAVSGYFFSQFSKDNSLNSAVMKISPVAANRELTNVLTSIQPNKVVAIKPIVPFNKQPKLTQNRLNTSNNKNPFMVVADSVSNSNTLVSENPISFSNIVEVVDNQKFSADLNVGDKNDFSATPEVYKESELAVIAKIADNKPVEFVEIAAEPASILEVIQKKNTENNSSESDKYVVKNNPYTTSDFSTNSVADVGTVRKVRSVKFKEYISVFKRYTDVSLYSLEKSNDITSELNSRFIDNPANAGIENRYSLSAGAKCGVIQTENQLFDVNTRDIYVGNSFAMFNNKVGVGLAVNSFENKNVNGLNFNLSSAYRLALTKNQQLRFGLGINASSLNYSTEFSPRSEVSMLSFHAGVRYNFKTIFAQASVNNIAPQMLRNDQSLNVIVPTISQLLVGGRLYLSKNWALHPMVSLIHQSNNVDVNVSAGLSCKNRWLMGVQTTNFNSVGIFAGMYASKRLSILLKTQIEPNKTSSSLFSESGEIMLKLELGNLKR